MCGTPPPMPLYKNSLKYCRNCNAYLDLSKFYHIYLNTHSTLCRKHTNTLRYENKLIQLIKIPKQKKVTGFLKCSVDTRKSILNDIANKKSLMYISKTYTIPYPTILNWRKGGQLVASVVI